MSSDEGGTAGVATGRRGFPSATQSITAERSGRPWLVKFTEFVTALILSPQFTLISQNHHLPLNRVLCYSVGTGSATNELVGANASSHRNTEVREHNNE